MRGCSSSSPGGTQWWRCDGLAALLLVLFFIAPHCKNALVIGCPTSPPSQPSCHSFGATLAVSCSPLAVRLRLGPLERGHGLPPWGKGSGERACYK